MNFKKCLAFPFILIFCCAVLLVWVPVFFTITVVSAPFAISFAVWKEEDVNEVFQFLYDMCAFPFKVVGDIFKNGL